MAIIPVHTMRDQPDYVGTMQRGMAFGNQLRQQRQEEERRNKLAQLGSQAYGAQGADRQALIGQAVGVDMQQGLALGGALHQNDAANMSAEDAQAKRLRGAAKFMMQAIESNDPAKIKGAHQAVANFMGGFGQPFPAEFTPEMVPKIQEVLARTAYLDEAGSIGGYKSRYIDDKGNVVVIMQDGSTKVVGKADPNMQIIEGEGGFYGVNRRNLNAAPVQLGGGAPQQATPQRTISNVQYRTADGQQIPQEEMAALHQAIQAEAAGQDFTIPVGGQAKFGGQLQAPAKDRPAYLQMSADEVAAAGLPAGTSAQRNLQTGQIDVINKGGVSTGGEKPMPTAALKLIQEETNAANAAASINQSIGRHLQRIDGGQLEFGPIDNLINRGRNFVGLSDEQSRNYQEFVSDLERLRNDSLRLNSGVQTDGDAQRAWNELFANLNDPAYVKQRLQTIQSLNQRAEQLRRLNADMILENYGRSEAAPQAQPSAPRRLKYNPQTRRIE